MCYSCVCELLEYRTRIVKIHFKGRYFMLRVRDKNVSTNLIYNFNYNFIHSEIKFQSRVLLLNTLTYPVFFCIDTSFGDWKLVTKWTWSKIQMKWTINWLTTSVYYCYYFQLRHFLLHLHICFLWSRFIIGQPATNKNKVKAMQYKSWGCIYSDEMAIN